MAMLRYNKCYENNNDMKIWFKQWKEIRMLKELVIEDFSEDTRTHKVFNSLDEACHQMDLSRPIWLESTIKDFKRGAKARFTKDAFVEEIDFDYLEIEVLEED